MKKRNSIVLLILILTLFHFSPLVTAASKNEINERESEKLKEDLIESKNETVVEDSIEATEDPIEEPTVEEKQDESVDEKKEIVDSNKSEEDIRSDSENTNTTDTNKAANKSLMQQKSNSNKKDESIEESKTMTSDVLKNGDYDDRVIDLKIDLGNLGFLSFENPTTYFGPITESGVMDFQEYYGLPVNGIADETTLNEIEKILSTPFQDGKRHKNTIKLKHNLGYLGFKAFLNPTTLYGPITAGLVKDFQKKYGLVVSGIADPITLAKIEELINGPMFDGLRRDDVIKFKEDLGKLGFLTFENPTTLYGPITEQGAKEFQQYYGLPVNGLGDEATTKKIEEILSSPFQDGKRHEDTVQLKENLRKLGFLSFENPTTLYGPITEAGVKNFQRYYGLTVNGIADKVTLSKVEEILSSPFQDGKRHEDTVQLKENLGKLGFLSFEDPTTLYGPITEQGVEDFQKYYGLYVNGIADDVTLAKIEEILSSPFQNGKRHPDTVKLKEDLAKLGFLSFENPTTLYGPITEQGVKDFQKEFNLPVSGIVDEQTMNKIKEALKGTKYTNYSISLDEALDIQMNAGAQTDQNYAYVSKTYIKNGKVTADALNVRTGPSVAFKSIGTLHHGQKVNVLEEVNGWYVIEHDDNEQWVNASPDDILYYLNPDNFINDAKQRFQFLDLSRSSDVSAAALNGYLKGKGKLAGQGQAFIEAGRINGINDVYLVSHAMLETGNGTSTLASGVPVDKNGNITRNSKGQIAKTAKTVATVYNMYGIHAFDGCALKCGAKKAFDEGWTTPAKAIKGGAKFIGNNYVKAGQNTLYKMRWNPQSMDDNGYATHQYATDIGWASKQIVTMHDLYERLGIKNVHLDIPAYSN